MDQTAIDQIVSKVVVRIKANAPQLTTSDETLNVFAEDAYNQALDDGFTGSKASIAAGWLGAHFAFLADNQNKAVSSEAADVLSHSFFDRKGGSDYLTEYERMKNSLFGGSGTKVSFY